MKFKTGDIIQHIFTKHNAIILDSDNINAIYTWKYINSPTRNINSNFILECVFKIINKKKSKLPKWF